MDGDTGYYATNLVVLRSGDSLRPGTIFMS